MTAQNVSCCSFRFRMLAGALLAAATTLVATEAANAQSYVLPPQQAYPAYGPSGSAVATQVDYDGRGMGVLWRAGHSTGETVGREESVSFITGTPFITVGENMFFGDLRLLRSNSGGKGDATGIAYSFGAGYRRYFADVDAVFGINAYIDNDELIDRFQAWGVGAELLSHNWEWRGNMYRPFGDSDFQTNVRAADGSARFEGDALLFDRIRTFSVAMEGYDTEIGVLLPGRFAAERQIRLFGGGYYYRNDSDDPIGWKARLQAQPFSWLELGVQVASDRLFDTTTSFNVALQLGGYRENVRSNTSRYRMAEPVRRNLTIATGSIEIAENGVPVLNPDGSQMTFAHANSIRAGRAGNNGTPETPFARIQEAQATGADVVFVHANSNYTSAANSAIILNPGQRVLGEGNILTRPSQTAVAHFVDVPEIGPLGVPASPTFLRDPTLGRPVLTGSANNGVTLASNAEFSGFVVNDPAVNSVFGDTIRTVVLNQNHFSGAGADGLRLLEPTDSINLTDTIIDTASGVAFHVTGGDAEILFEGTTDDPDGLQFSDPGFGAITNSSNHIIRISDTTGGQIVFDRATLDEIGGNGVLIERAAGNVTIDNLAVRPLDLDVPGGVGSQAHGIRIVDSSGTYRFINSVRDETLLRGTTDTAISIEGLAATGSVVFEDNVEIVDRRSGGINIANSAGTIEFEDAVEVRRPPFGVVTTTTGVNIENSASTSSTIFRDELRINDGSGIGLRIAGSQANATSTSTVTFEGLVEVIDPDQSDGIQITSNAGNILFGNNLQVIGYGQRGIAIDAMSGDLTFAGAPFAGNQQGYPSLIRFQIPGGADRTGTLVQNTGASLQSGIEISNSTGDISFLGRTDAEGGLGLPMVSIFDNQSAGSGILFESLAASSNGGDTLFIDNSSSVTVQGGLISTDDAGSIDVVESGINLTFEAIRNFDTTGTQDAIRLTDVFAPDDPTGPGFLEVTGTATSPLFGPGGGTIDGHSRGVVITQNNGTSSIVRLNSMLFNNNAIQFLVDYDSVVDPIGELTITNSTVQESLIRGIDATNLPILNIAGTQFLNNGRGFPIGWESMLLTYDETPNDPDLNRPEDYDQPFRITMDGVTVVDNSDDAVIIQALGGATDAHLRLLVSDSSFTATDSDADIIPPVVRAPSPFEQFHDDAFIVSWNGPMHVNMTNNDFVVPGLGVRTDGQHGLSIVNAHQLDFSEIILSQNRVSGATGLHVNDLGGNPPLFREEAIGVLVATTGNAFVNINSNTVTGRGGNYIGMLLDFANPTDLTVANNTIDVDFRAQGLAIPAFARGMIFNRVTEESMFRLDGNRITVFGTSDIRDQGLFIQAVGRLDLFGDDNNEITTAAGAINFLYRGSRPNGQFIINGSPQP